MEHRCHERIPGNFRVDLWNDAGCLRYCKVRDFAPGGLFVEAETAGLRESECLKVIIVPGPMFESIQVLTGFIRHRCAEGVGIKLTESIAPLPRQRHLCASRPDAESADP